MPTIRLSDRDIKMLEMVANGATNKAIAKHFGLSVFGTDKALGKIYDKLGAVSRTHAVALASAKGFLDEASIKPSRTSFKRRVKLSDGETRALYWADKGLDTLQTAHRMGTTRNTVSVSLNRAKRKLGAPKDLQAAIRRAKLYGFLDQVA